MHVFKVDITVDTDMDAELDDVFAVDFNLSEDIPAVFLFGIVAQFISRLSRMEGISIEKMLDDLGDNLVYSKRKLREEGLNRDGSSKDDEDNEEPDFS